MSGIGEGVISETSVIKIGENGAVKPFLAHYTFKKCNDIV